MPEIPRYQRTQLPAASGRGARLPIGQPTGGGRALAGAFGFLGQLAADLEESEAVSFTSLESAKMMRRYSIRGPEARGQAPEGAPGFAPMMDAEVGDDIDEVLARAPNDQARELFQERATEFRTKFFASNMTFEVAAGRKKRLTDFDRGIAALGVATFNDPGGAGKYLAQGRGDLTAAAATWMLPVDASERRSRLEPAIATAAVRGLIVTNPKAAVAALDAGVFDAGLDATIKATLGKSAKEAVDAMEREREAAVKAAEKAAAKARKEAQAATQNDYLARLKDPEKKPPGVGEILASNLEPTGQGSKKTFIDLAEKKLRGKDLDFTDPRVYRARREAILDGSISDPETLLDDVGRGLGITDYERLAADIEKGRTEKGKAELGLRKRALQLAAKELVTSNSLLGISDPEGERRLYALEFELDEALGKGEAAGKSYRSMLDPGSPDYVLGPLIETYRESPLEAMARQAREFSGKPAAPAGAAPAARKPGESIAEWRKRTGR